MPFTKISLHRLLGAEDANRLINAGLHNLAAGRLNAEGIKVSQAFTLSEAVYALGTKLFKKNANYAKIITGFNAFKDLNERS